MENLLQAEPMYSEHGAKFASDKFPTVRAYVNVMEAYLANVSEYAFYEYNNLSIEQKRNIIAEQWTIVDILKKMKEKRNLDKDIWIFLDEVKTDYTNKKINAKQETNQKFYGEVLDVLHGILCMINGIHEESEY